MNCENYNGLGETSRSSYKWQLIDKILLYSANNTVVIHNV